MNVVYQGLWLWSIPSGNYTFGTRELLWGPCYTSAKVAVNWQLRNFFVRSSALIHSFFIHPSIQKTFVDDQVLSWSTKYTIRNKMLLKKTKEESLTCNRINVMMEEIERTVFRNYLVWIWEVRSWPR